MLNTSRLVARIPIKVHSEFKIIARKLGTYPSFLLERVLRDFIKKETGKPVRRKNVGN